MIKQELFAAGPIDMRKRKPGLGAAVTVPVVCSLEDGTTVTGDYSGVLVGIYADDNGEGFYLFEGDIRIQAVKENFQEPASATATIINYDAA